MTFAYIFLIFFAQQVQCYIEIANESGIFDVIGEIVSRNYIDKGWKVLLLYGLIPKEFFMRTNHLPLSTVQINSSYSSTEASNDVPVLADTVVMSCIDFNEYNTALNVIIKMVIWNPHCNIIIHVDKLEERDIANIFFSMWWNQAINAIIIQQNESISVMRFTPFSHKGYHFESTFTCWAKRKWSPFSLVLNLTRSTHCQPGCEIENETSNIKQASPSQHLKSCISYTAQLIKMPEAKEVRVRHDTSNLHGFPLTAFGSNTPPFLDIKVFENGTSKISMRDGFIWTTLADKINFTIKLMPLETEGKFVFELNAKMIFDMSSRAVDIILFPVYQMDLIVTVTELLFPVKDGGVCVLARRAGLDYWGGADMNGTWLLQLLALLVIVWGTIALFTYFDVGKLTCDQLGNDLSNAVRIMLSMCVYNTPRRWSFKLFLGVSLWSFFASNFIIQASITSFFMVLKRSPNIETLREVVNRGYPIQGFWTPDTMLPESEEIYRKFNDLKEKVEDMFECMELLQDKPNLFCLMDCTMAQYYQHNKLNKESEPYLHVVSERVHSRYLNMILPYKSPLSAEVNRHIMAMSEGGLIQHSRNEKKIVDRLSYTPIALSNIDLAAKMYIFFLSQVFFVFIVEVTIGNFLKHKLYRRVSIWITVKYHDLRGFFKWWK